jgi:hypothetical protein
MTSGSANARMKVEIGLRTQMSSRFLRTNAQSCLRSKFMMLDCLVLCSWKRRFEREKGGCALIRVLRVTLTSVMKQRIGKDVLNTLVYTASK